MLITGSSTTLLGLVLRFIALVAVLLSCLSVRTAGTPAGGADDGR
jgi:hypothetical protein